MNHHATNPTIADKKVRPATHYEKREGFIPAKSNHCGKRILALRLDPKLRSAAYAQRSVSGARRGKMDSAACVYCRHHPFSNPERRPQKPQLLMNVAGS